MTKWRPIIDFDEQQLQIQPDCDTTFGYYPQNGADENEYQLPENETLLMDRGRNLIQRIIENSQKDKLVGRRITSEEVDDVETREIETISMIRSAGMSRSVDESLSSSRTIPAIESTKPHTRQGSKILLYDEVYFKLRPRKKSFIGSDTESPSSADSSYKKDNDALKSNGRISEKNKAKNNSTISTGKSNHVHSSPTSVRADLNRSRSPLPVPRDNSHTPVLQISNTKTEYKSQRKSKIGANFAVLDAKTRNPTRSEYSVDNPVRLQECRNSLVFITPAELYRRKRQQANKE